MAGSGRGRHGRRYRYGAYTGGPDPLAPPFDVREAVDAVGERVLAGESLREALRDVLRQGTDGRRGLDDLLSRLRRRRNEVARSGRLDGAVTRAAALLDQALATERDALSARPEGDLDADFAKARLESLPDSTAAAVRELRDYEWTSPEARQLYDQILGDLREQVLDRQFAGMREALKQAATDPGAQAAMREMLQDLNQLLRDHADGKDTDDSFAEFMAKHGDTLGESPENVDELIDLLARRAAAGQQLMNSLTPEQRAELGDLMNQALGESGLGDEMAELSLNLRDLRPDLAWSGRRRLGGEEPLGYADATSVLQELSELDSLAQSLGGDPMESGLDAVDVDAVERQLGRGAADDVRRLAELERQLRSQGWLNRGPEGLTLSPKALRRIAATALRTVFAEVEKGRRGEHDVASAGAAGDLTGSSRRWQLGDTQPLDVVRTVSNAIRRQAGENPTGTVTLDVEDFEVAETEQRSGAAVALLVDLSFSMVMEGRWGPMKQTALALAHLVATRYPQDALQIIGFGRYAQTLSLSELAAVEPDFEQGTNLAHALALAGRHLRKHSGADPVVMVVTDGEPTAHLDPDGYSEFHWPPAPETVQATVTEVDHLARYGAVVNLFMLGEQPGLRRFVDAVARRCGGRVLTPDPDDLGEYVVADYLRLRHSRSR